MRAVVIPDCANSGEPEILDPANEVRGFANSCAGSRLGARLDEAWLGRDDSA
jgi:hypothetical protein